MKVISIAAFVAFMALAIYLLLHEKEFMGESRHRKLQPVSKSKIIGQRQERELQPFELQRQRINNEAIFKFENSDTNETYEFREDEMAEFDSALKTLKEVKREIKGDTTDPNVINNTKVIKEYYEVD
ncbi:hypothetical protein C0V70_02700 [Bacteriovorax stolpii]|uniref:Uncharacterized protein n=1 Tax=Bacteriovorax stolpii TaxID=960 RepID=A0A2K9NNC7_BACTC|nr:hypothetical protein [Bacteriovorax stolpii]AUN97031.1 hypothetical protein C0V70_02700 [Bacteriovorax stolpii]TDP53318.1 hypothetical protein C8D79_1960 [Bacteriovorax stolpii]